jgi:hypothetical protein
MTNVTDLGEGVLSFDGYTMPGTAKLIETFDGGTRILAHLEIYLHAVRVTGQRGAFVFRRPDRPHPLTGQAIVADCTNTTTTLVSDGPISGLAIYP